MRIVCPSLSLRSLERQGGDSDFLSLPTTDSAFSRSKNLTPLLK
jgi:hypothetical protein